MFGLPRPVRPRPVTGGGGRILWLGLALAGCTGAPPTSTLIPAGTVEPTPTNYLLAMIARSQTLTPGVVLPSPMPPTLVLKAATPTPIPPTATHTPAPTPLPPTVTPTPIPALLEVVQSGRYTTPGGGLVVFGLVRNAGTTAIQRLRVVARADDSAGTTVGAGSDGFLAQTALESGEVAPFFIVLSPLSGKLADLVLQTQAELYLPNSRTNPRLGHTAKAEGLKLAALPKSTGYQLTGRVRNTGEWPITLIQVLAAGYDGQDKLVDVSKAVIPLDPVLAGEVAPFSLTFRRPDARIARYDLLIVSYERR